MSAAGACNIGWRQVLAEEPWAHDFFRALNMHEALAADRPRIGDSATRREEYLDLGQVPFLDFPASAVASYEPKTERDKARLRVKFLGLLGPMGPLPSTHHRGGAEMVHRAATTPSSASSTSSTTGSCSSSSALIPTRGPPRTGCARSEDRFRDYVGSAMGIGGPSWRDLDSMPDLQKCAFAGLLGSAGDQRLAHRAAGHRHLRHRRPRSSSSSARTCRVARTSRRGSAPRMPLLGTGRHGRAPRAGRRHQVPAAALSRHAGPLREIPAERRLVPPAGRRDRRTPSASNTSGTSSWCCPTTSRARPSSGPTAGSAGRAGCAQRGVHREGRVRAHAVLAIRRRCCHNAVLRRRLEQGVLQ